MNSPSISFGRPGKPKGFTLVEVVAALVLVAIALPVIMRGISVATSASSISKQRTQAATLASLKLHELVGTGQWQNGNQSGDFAGEWPDYQWSSELTEWSGVETQQLDVHVTWMARNQKQTFTLSTLVYNNAPVGPQSTTAAPSMPSNGSRSLQNTNNLGGLP